MEDSAEKNSLFRVLQGDLTDEQLEAWRQMNTESSGLVLEPSQCATDSETLLSDGDNVIVTLPNAEIVGHASHVTPTTDTVPPDWSILDVDPDVGSGRGEQSTESGVRERLDSVLRLAQLSKQASTVSDFGVDGEEFSALALNSPEVLATYLTGKMTFGDFFKAVEDAKIAHAGKTGRGRKRKVDGDFVYDDDDDDENDDDDDDDDYDDINDEREQDDEKDTSWLPESNTKSRSDGPKKKPRKPRRKNWELPKSLRGLMGEANSQLAQGNYEEASNMCLELIRRAPAASQPYDVLAMLYDEQELTEKATEVLLMSAYLKRSDTDLWLNVTNRFLNQNQIRKAMICLTQAIKFASNKFELMQEKCLLYEQLGEMPKALMGYNQMLTLIEPSAANDDKYLALARNLCQTYHNMRRTNDAARILTTMFKTRPSLINSDDMNKLLDLRMTMKQYQACLEGLVDYCGVEVTLSTGDEWNATSPLPSNFDLKTMPGALSSVRVPDNLPQGFPLDLLTKLCTCLIHLNYSDQAQHLVGVLLKEEVEEEGNVERFMDVADAYMETEQHRLALPILRRCVHSHSYSQAAVWLRYGQCLNVEGHLVEAVEAFSKVVAMAPSHLGARVSLSALQQQIGRHDEALQVLSTGGEGEGAEGGQEDQTLLLHKCHLLLSQNRRQEFVKASQRLLFCHFRQTHRLCFSQIIYGYRSFRHRTSALLGYMKEHAGQEDMHAGQSRQAGDKDSESKKDRTDREKDRTDGEKDKTDRKEDSDFKDELWDLYLKLCDVLLEDNRLEELEEVTLLGLSCPPFITHPTRVKAAEFLCLSSCLMNKDGQFAYRFIKNMCFKDPNNAMIWNLLNQTFLHCTDIRHHKFCLRRLLKWPDHLALSILNGHNSVQNGSYRCALGEYMTVFRRMPTDPMISLVIGLCYLHICCQKYTTRKDWLVLESISFLNMYQNLRGHCQESYYNLGRAMQQIGMNYAAVYYYKKALSLPPIIDDQHGMFDLRRETAFNLSLIYKKSGNLDLARLCLQTYVVV